MKKFVRGHEDLEVWQRSFDLAMRVFELSGRWPKAETYSLTDQIRRSSRSTTANIAEAWEKRRYEGSFIAKLVDSMAEAAETQTWVRFAAACDYIDAADESELCADYSAVLRTLNAIIVHSTEWCEK